MYADEILRQRSSESDNSFELSTRQKAIFCSFFVGAGMGAAYANFYKAKYWKAMLIGGVGAAFITLATTLK
jgi:hypothetical protein